MVFIWHMIIAQVVKKPSGMSSSEIERLSVMGKFSVRRLVSSNCCFRFFLAYVCRDI